MGYMVVPTPEPAADPPWTGFDPSVGVVLLDLDFKGSTDALSIERAVSASAGASVVFLADNAEQIARVKTEASQCGWVESPFHPIELFFEIQIALEKKQAGKDVHSVVATAASA
jgi:hypothetical protein